MAWGVRSFNPALYLRPFGAVEEDGEGFPALVRLVDRGDPISPTADMGARELYTAGVIASDLFATAQALAQYFPAS